MLTFKVGVLTQFYFLPTVVVDFDQNMLLYLVWFNFFAGVFYVSDEDK